MVRGRGHRMALQFWICVPLPSASIRPPPYAIHHPRLFLRAHKTFFAGHRKGMLVDWYDNCCSSGKAAMMRSSFPFRFRIGFGVEAFYRESERMDATSEVLLVEGGTRLEGSVRVSGSKNSVLPIMAATLLTRGKNEIRNVPLLRDVHTMAHLLRILGAKVRNEGDRWFIDTSTCDYHEVPYQLVRTMRASIYVLGPLLAKLGEATVPLPGGCAWGPRPVNFHLQGLRSLGASVELMSGEIVARTDGLVGGEIGFSVPSVGATAQLMMAASLARGTTRIQNAALEPEIADLTHCLVAMGARIDGIGSSTLVIDGVRELRPVSYEVIPDRIEAGTLLLAGAVTRGRVTLEGVKPEHLTAVLEVLSDTGTSLSISGNQITVSARGKLRPCTLVAEPYPGFPTDMQAQMTAFLATIPGVSRVEDRIYRDRFRHVAELRRLGAEIDRDEAGVLIRGARGLRGAPVEATDLRASAALVLAALAATGITEISGLTHLDRGYEQISKKLACLGARVTRVVRHPGLLGTVKAAKSQAVAG